MRPALPIEDGGDGYTTGPAGSRTINFGGEHQVTYELRSSDTGRLLARDQVAGSFPGAVAELFRRSTGEKELRTVKLLAQSRPSGRARVYELELVTAAGDRQRVSVRHEPGNTSEQAVARRGGPSPREVR